MNLAETYRTFYPNTKEYTFFSAAHGTFSKIYCVHKSTGHKASLNNRYMSLPPTAFSCDPPGWQPHPSPGIISGLFKLQHSWPIASTLPLAISLALVTLGTIQPLSPQRSSTWRPAENCLTESRQPAKKKIQRTLGHLGGRVVFPKIINIG